MENKPDSVIDQNFFEGFGEAKIERSFMVRELDSELYEKTIYLALNIKQATEVHQELEKQLKKKSWLGDNGAVGLCLGTGLFPEYATKTKLIKRKFVLPETPEAKELGCMCELLPDSKDVYVIDSDCSAHKKYYR